MGSDQFALRAFDGVAMFHPLFELLGSLFLPAPLQNRVLLADDQAAVFVSGGDALQGVDFFDSILFSHWPRAECT